jgi:hypothetical protein
VICLELAISTAIVALCRFAVTHDVDVFVEIVKYSCSLHGSGREDWLHDRFNPGSHFFSGNSVGKGPIIRSF